MKKSILASAATLAMVMTASAALATSPADVSLSCKNHTVSQAPLWQRIVTFGVKQTVENTAEFKLPASAKDLLNDLKTNGESTGVFICSNAPALISSKVSCSENGKNPSVEIEYARVNSPDDSDCKYVLGYSETDANNVKSFSQSEATFTSGGAGRSK